MTKLPAPFLVFALAILALPACANAATPLSVADLLFAGLDAHRLSPADRTEIAARLPMTLQDGQVVSSIPGCAGRPMRPAVKIADMNRDGFPEVLVHAGNACTSGVTGASLWLLAKDADGRWQNYLEVAAIDYRLLESRVQGWNELALTGRAECIGIWQHRGERFVFARAVTPEGGPCKP